MLFLGTYESQLLESQERAMVQQGRLLASALVGHDLAEEAEAILGRLGGRTDARLRVVNPEGRLLADSARPSSDGFDTSEDSAAGGKIRIKAQREKNQDTAPETPDESAEDDDENPKPLSYPEESVIYNLGALPARLFRALSGFLRPPEEVKGDAEYYSGRDILDGPEIKAALSGRYGAATRLSSEQRSVNLYSAIPILKDNTVIGAILVSRSTIGILADLYQLRRDIMVIFLFSVGAAVVLSILLARTVTVPVGRLRDQAESILDERGKLQDRFKPLSGRDEVADLSRALYRLSARLQERTDHLEQFMADLVHEMKNPVAGILSAAELAGPVAGEESKRFLTVINREGRRIQRLLDDLRELISVDVRLDNGRKTIVDIDDLISNIVSVYPMHRTPNVTLDLTTKNNTPIMVEADPDRLAQAVLNLVDNAVSFSPKGGTVEISLEQTAGCVRISIADRGPGFPPETTKKIFERWYTDRPESEASDHTGLGLAIVKGITEGYGGTITAMSREGGGALFILELPTEG